MCLWESENLLNGIKVIVANKVLITGSAGYIGSVLARKLLECGYYVRGMDILYFGGNSLEDIYNHPNFEFVKGDIRKKNDINVAIREMDAVVHLAAIVGDPACAKQPELAEETNWVASKLLYDLCSETNHIKQFIFASTCSNYGLMEGNGFVKEDSPLMPISHYAKLKVRFEEYLLNKINSNGMVATSLRFSTVYGLSPRMRFDLTVNDFIREVTMGKELVVFGEQFWRPYCHVEDLARSCILVLESDKKKVARNVFGVGDIKENYTKKMIVSEILKTVPKAKIKFIYKNEDPRNYRVDFSKIKNELSFKITKTVPDGLREVHSFLKSGLLSEPYSSKYTNVGDFYD